MLGTVKIQIMKRMVLKFGMNYFSTTFVRKNTPVLEWGGVKFFSILYSNSESHRFKVAFCM